MTQALVKNAAQIVLALDPSINNLGWSVVGSEMEIQVAGGTYHPKGEDLGRLEDLTAFLALVIEDYQITDVVIEVPNDYQKKRRSFAVLKKYLLAVGACIATGWASGAEVHTIEVNEYKGKGRGAISKAQHRREFALIRGRQARTSDESDADALARWWLGQRRIEGRIKK